MNSEHTLDKIKCPNCGDSFPVTQALYHQIAERAREEIQQHTARREKELEVERQRLKEERVAIETTVSQRTKAATAEIEKQAQAKAHDAVSVELEDLKRQAAEKDKKLVEAREAELEWLKQKRVLDERAKNIELESARKMEAERQTIQDETARRVTEEYRLRDAEKDKKLQDALRVNDELKRKLEQGSQQTQGEVLELHLEEHIRAAFPSDQIDPVPKGMKGADVIQQVFNRSGQLCGTIVWESKRTKAWSDEWLQKLKDDQRALKAEIAIIVSDVVPKDLNGFAQKSGIWVSTFPCAINVAAILRSQLIQLASVRSAAVGKNEKMELLYGYLTSTEFRHRVEAIAEAFMQMQNDLLQERRVAEKSWAKRQKEIDRVFQNTAGMYGELQGLLGSTSLQDIPALTASDDRTVDDHVVARKLPKAIAQLGAAQPEDVSF
jgi:hypothetical protein